MTKKSVVVNFPMVYGAEHARKGKRNPRSYVLIDAVPMFIPVLSDEDFPVVGRIDVPTISPEAAKDENFIGTKLLGYEPLDARSDVELEKITLRTNENGHLMMPVLFGAGPGASRALNENFARAALLKGVEAKTSMGTGMLDFGDLHVSIGKPMNVRTMSEMSDIIKSVICEKENIGNRYIHGKIGKVEDIVKGKMLLEGIPFFPQFGVQEPGFYTDDVLLTSDDPGGKFPFDAYAPEMHNEGRRHSDMRKIAEEKLQDIISRTFRADERGNIYILCNEPRWENSVSNYPKSKDVGVTIHVPLLYPRFHGVKRFEDTTYSPISRTVSRFKSAQHCFETSYEDAYDDMIHYARRAIRPNKFDATKSERDLLKQEIKAVRDFIDLTGKSEIISCMSTQDRPIFCVIPKDPEKVKNLFGSFELVDPDFIGNEHNAQSSNGFYEAISEKIHVLRTALREFIDTTLDGKSKIKMPLEVLEDMRILQARIDLNPIDLEHEVMANEKIIENLDYLTNSVHCITSILKRSKTSLAFDDYAYLMEVFSEVMDFDPISGKYRAQIENTLQHAIDKMGVNSDPDSPEHMPLTNEKGFLRSRVAEILEAQNPIDPTEPDNKKTLR